LLAGVPVVATATPALDALASSVVLDDFLGGLRLYLGDKERADADVARGRQVIHRAYGQVAIAAAWVDVIAAATHTQVRIARPDAQLILALHLIQDLDLALPVLLTIAETNLGPHRFTRSLTNNARSAGLATATLQHGFENVGLTCAR